MGHPDTTCHNCRQERHTLCTGFLVTYFPNSFACNCNHVPKGRTPYKVDQGDLSIITMRHWRMNDGSCRGCQQAYPCDAILLLETLRLIS